MRRWSYFSWSLLAEIFSFNLGLFVGWLVKLNQQHWTQASLLSDTAPPVCQGIKAKGYMWFIFLGYHLTWSFKGKEIISFTFNFTWNYIDIRYNMKMQNIHELKTRLKKGSPFGASTWHLPGICVYSRLPPGRTCLRGESIYCHISVGFSFTSAFQ